MRSLRLRSSDEGVYFAGDLDDRKITYMYRDHTADLSKRTSHTSLLAGIDTGGSNLVLW
jgi:hypothetical protein